MDNSLQRQMRDPEVSVVIANWNVRDLLRQAIRSVEENSPTLPHEIIVVDDASTDGSVDMVRREFPTVRLLINEKNLGFSRANNRGAAIARGRYLFLLNTDTLFVGDPINTGVDFLEHRPDAGVCGCRLKSPDGSSQVSFGDFPSLFQALFDALFLNDLFPHAGFPKRGAYPDVTMTGPIRVGYVTGAAIMVRKSLVDRIGLFDELFRAYSEETDFCYRVKHVARMNVYFLPEAKVIHLGGASYRNAKKYQIQLMFSSYHKFLKKYHGSVYSFCTRLLYAWRHFLQMIVRFVRYLIAARSLREEKRKYFVLAWYAVRYSLIPDERFSGQ